MVVETHNREDLEQVEVELQIKVEMEILLQQILLKETQVVEMVVETLTIMAAAVAAVQEPQVNRYLKVCLFQECTVVMEELAHQQILQVRT